MQRNKIISQLKRKLKKKFPNIDIQESDNKLAKMPTYTISLKHDCPNCNKKIEVLLTGIPMNFIDLIIKGA